MNPYVKCKVVNCHELSVVKDIFCPEKDESNIVERHKAGDILNVDTSRVYWDSYDRQYYKVDIGRNFDTFVATGGENMIKVLNDNTKNKLYTICKGCRSELEYDYSDVCVSPSNALSTFPPNRVIICPCCKFETFAELSTKENYNDNFSNIPFPTCLPNT